MPDLPSAQTPPILSTPASPWTNVSVGGATSTASASVALWQGPFQLFTTSSGPIAGVHWNRSIFTQPDTPIVVDAETPASTYVASGLNDYTIEMAAQNWDADQQAVTYSLGTTGPISLPFTLAAGAPASSSSGFAMWWSASATPGTYDINLETYTDNPDLVATSTPSLTPSGHAVTLETAVSDPLSWAYAKEGDTLVLLYGTQASSTTEDLNVRVFDTTGAASGLAEPEMDVPLSTVDGLFISNATGAIVLAATAVANGVGPCMTFTPINPWNSIIVQAIPAPAATGSDATVIEAFSLRNLTNGNILEFVESLDTSGAVPQQDITTRLLNSSFTDISASTSSFQSAEFDSSYQGTPDHWQTVALDNGDVILVDASGGAISIAEFNTNGDELGTIGFTPNPTGSAQPTDFDSLVAMGSRFEITYRMPDASNGGNNVFGVIYDTATQAYSYTIDDTANPDGQYVGTPYNDTVTYGAGVNEVDGGGGTDTFVATNFSASQVSVTINAQGNVLLSDGQGDVDTLERFSKITLADATITIGASTLTQTNTDGSSVASDFNITGAAYTETVQTFDAAGDMTSVSYDGFADQPYEAVKYTFSITASSDSTSTGYDVYYTGQSSGLTEIDYDGAGNMTAVDYAGPGGQNNYASLAYSLSGGTTTGVYAYYTAQSSGLTEARYNGAGQMTEEDFAFADAPSGSPHALQIHYVDGQLADSFYDFTGPGGSDYSTATYEFDYASQYSGVTYNYVVSGQAYDSVAVSYTAGSSPVKTEVTYGSNYTGTTNPSSISYFYDSTTGAYTGVQKIFTGITGQSYTSMTEDINAAGIITALEYSGYSGSATTIGSGETTGFITGSHALVARSGLSAQTDTTISEGSNPGGFIGVTGGGDDPAFTSQTYFKDSTGTTQYVLNDYSLATGNIQQQTAADTVIGGPYEGYETISTASNTLIAVDYHLDTGAELFIGTGSNLSFPELGGPGTASNTQAPAFAISGGDWTVTGGGSGDAFTFAALFNTAEITDYGTAFNAGTPDIVSVSTTDFANWQVMLSEASASGSSSQNTTFTASTTGDKLTLDGVTVSQLQALTPTQAAADFKFHA